MEGRIMNLVAKANRFRKSWARASAVATSGLLVSICLGVPGLLIQASQAQSKGADLQPFVGTWQAKFKGKVFETIKLEKKQDKLTGTVSHADVNVDPKTGELIDAKVHEGSDTIVEAKLTGGILRITEGDDVQFDMKITGTDEAQLQVVVPPDGI